MIIMQYDEFQAQAMQEYKKLPNETSELYKRYSIGLDIKGSEKFGKVMDDKKQIKEISEGFAKALRSRFDVIIGNGNVILNGIKLAKALLPKELDRSFFENRLYKSGEDKFVAFVYAYSRLILQIEIPEEAKQTLNVLFVNTQSSASPVQILINAAERSASTINEFYTSNNVESVMGVMHEIRIAGNADMELNAVHVESSNTNVLGFLKGVVGEKSYLFVNQIYTGGRLTRQRSSLEAMGPSSNVEINELLVGMENQKADIYTEIINANTETACRSEMRAVLMGSSAANLKSFARVRHGAKHSRSYVKERGILYDKGTYINLLPDMLVDESEVKATHSGASSPANEEEIFYLATRGIEREEAKRLIVTGFLGEMIARIRNGSSRMAALTVVNERLRNRRFGMPAELDISNAWASDLNQEAGVSSRMFESNYKYTK